MRILKNQIKGCIKFSVKGKNLYKFINALRSERLNCSNQYCKNNIYYGEVTSGDFETVKLLAEQYGMEIDFFEYETLRKKLFRYRHRYGIIIGIILIIASLFYFSNIVLTIEIQGNRNVSDTVVLSMLEELGIKKGTFLSDINFSSCERKLRMNNPDISWVGMRHTGNRLVIEMTEIVHAPEMLNERMPCNIVSAQNAQITKISIYSGQIMRGVGDCVRKNDVLVSGVVTDNKGHVNLRHSLGSVTAIYEDSITIHQDFTEKIYQDTGNTYNEKYLNLFNFNIPLFLGKNKFSSYNTDTICSPVFLFGKEMPINFVKNKLSEKKLIEKTYTLDEAKAVIEEKVFLYEKNFLSDVNIMECSLDYSQTESGLDCTVKYTVEGEIGIQKDIWAK